MDSPATPRSNLITFSPHLLGPLLLQGVERVKDPSLPVMQPVGALISEVEEHGSTSQSLFRRASKS